ncbi:MAG: hypothetical protein KKA16_11540 [Alphaproteobacteria bacterium]|nr:hypothetical protein [Alphaproteobacteria bacterium]MBU2380830.1 hypothetical protein [Alphaproteobacteria bacterium]
MRKDEKKMPPRTAPQQLPMPTYDYQKPQGGSAIGPYRGQEPRAAAPAHVLQNIHFG